MTTRGKKPTLFVVLLGEGGEGGGEKRKRKERKRKKQRGEREWKTRRRRQTSKKNKGKKLRGKKKHHPHPDGDQRHHGQQRRAHRAHEVAPRPAAVHQPVEERQPPLEQRVAERVEDDLEVALGPPRPLLEAVADLVGGLPDREVLLDVAAVPAALLELHAEGEVLGEGVLGGPAEFFFRSCFGFF